MPYATKYYVCYNPTDDYCTEEFREKCSFISKPFEIRPNHYIVFTLREEMAEEEVKALLVEGRYTMIKPVPVTECPLPRCARALYYYKLEEMNESDPEIIRAYFKAMGAREPSIRPKYAVVYGSWIILETILKYTEALTGMPPCFSKTQLPITDTWCPVKSSLKTINPAEARHEEKLDSVIINRIDGPEDLSNLTEDSIQTCFENQLDLGKQVNLKLLGVETSAITGLPPKLDFAEFGDIQNNATGVDYASISEGQCINNILDGYDASRKQRSCANYSLLNNVQLDC